MNSDIYEVIQSEIQNGELFKRVFRLVLSGELNKSPAGSLEVILRDCVSEVEVLPVTTAFKAGDERATILWLPWKQGEVTTLSEYSIQHAKPNTLFLTQNLSGCKLLNLRNGPVWHIDAEVIPDEFFPIISSNEWVEDNWMSGQEDLATYFVRNGQETRLWNLSKYIEGALYPEEYGKDNKGDALVAGFVNDSGGLNLYYTSQKVLWWVPAAQKTMKRK